MNVPMSWINEYVPLDGVDVYEYMDRLTMIGQKTEGVDRVAEGLCGIVVGRILSLKRHDGADRLFVAEVDAGNGINTVVTGAENVFEGAYVPVALEGAVIADGTVIGKNEFRGVLSDGMLCSIEELGFTRNDFPEAPEHGIYIFDKELQPGTDVCEALELRQDVVEYEITGNRPDCFSVAGIAREAAAAYLKPFTHPDLSVKEEADGNAADMISIDIKDKGLCPRYAARVVKNVKISASPLWLRRRLTSAGVRPINNIVDITNYVMLEMGQPMHAFDLKEVSGGIIVKRAKDGESFVTLDGISRELDSSMLVIADHEKSLAIAGVMGGENSKISLSADGKEATGAVLLESACFNGTNIRLTSKKLGLRTDASGKFEKGLDPNLAELAVNRAANLIELLGAGDVVKGISDCYPDREALSKKAEIPFEPDRINSLLGTEISADEMKRLLSLFEIEVNDGFAVIPTFRGDIDGIADLAEEVARAYGYDVIKPEMLSGAPTVGKKSYKQAVLDTIKDAMVSFGFYEAITFSFEGPSVFDKLLVPAGNALRRAVPIMNPLGENYGIMRTTAANSMLDSISTNYNKRNAEAYLFETANVYFPNELPVKTLPIEKNLLIAGMYGKDADFYAAKGYVETLFDILGIAEYDFTPTADIPWMHPGRTASVEIKGCVAGFVGEAHPACLDNYEIGKKVYLFQLDTTALCEASVELKRFEALPKYPAVQRDIAVVVPEDALVKDIQRVIAERGGELLKEMALFDIYRGGQVGEGMKSIAYSLVFRSKDRTLEDAEVSEIVAGIVAGLTEELGAKIRE